MYLRLLRRLVLMNTFEGDGGGGGASETSAVPSTPAVEPAALPASTPETPAVDTKPKTMLDAINDGLAEKRTREADPNAKRDPQGKFVPKVASEKVAPGTLATSVEVKAAPTDPARQDDDTPPEGLTPKSQERFQRLVSEKKELAGKVDILDRQVSYVRDTFATHGVKQEQFEQAASIIGLINKGDYAGAKGILERELQQLAVLSGEPVRQVDGLASFPDLRQAVDAQQITEAVAMELAKGRTMQYSQQINQQRQQEVQKSETAERKAVEDGTSAVDRFCKQMLATDLDYGQIEAQLLPVIPQLLQGVAPQHWERIVKTQYDLIKKVAGSAKQAIPGASSNPLRPTGQGAPSAAPKTAFEAMWGTPAPR